jgi:hypothetical protein
MMRRREFMTLLGGAAAAWPLPVGASSVSTPSFLAGQPHSRGDRVAH